MYVRTVNAGVRNKYFLVEVPSTRMGYCIANIRMYKQSIFRRSEFYAKKYYREKSRRRPR